MALCGAGRTVVPVDTPALADAREVMSAGWSRDAVEGVAAIMTRELGLPLPPRFCVFIYETPEAFRQGLLADAGIAADRVDELAGFAVGIARPGRVFLDARVARPRAEWLRLIAHELTHVAQFELAGGEGRGEQWLAEGLAEYVAFRVLERLGVESLAERETFARRRARDQAGFAQARLDLASLGSQRGFTLRHQREGSVETYQLAFLMAEYLVRRDGFERAVGYFARLRREGREAAFQRAFGQSLSDFEREVLAHLRRALEAP